jgi:hypothetical protein
MSPFFAIIERVAPGLYILLGFGAVMFFIRWRRARREFLDTGFELVRDLAHERERTAFIRWFTLCALAVLVLLIQQVVIPSARLNEALVATAATIEPTFITTTPVPAGEVDISNLLPDTGDPAFTPTITLTPVGTIMPDARPAAGCDTPNARLQVPANGMRVFDTLQVIGTANATNFALYKLELRGPGTADMYAVIAESTTAITEPAVLGQVVALAFEPGDYEFRLTVFDSSNTLVAACMVNIFLSAAP